MYKEHNYNIKTKGTNIDKSLCLKVYTKLKSFGPDPALYGGPFRGGFVRIRAKCTY